MNGPKKYRAYLSEETYNEAIQRMSCAFAYHEAVFDENDTMIDYIFLDVNKSFEDLTGLKLEEVLNKRFVADVSTDKEAALKWVNLYSKVLDSDIPLDIEEYSEEYKKYYSVKAYRSGHDHFTTLFIDKTAERIMEEIAQYFVRNMGNSIDYYALINFACKISGACFGTLNLRDELDSGYTTVSICGVDGRLEEVLSSLGLSVLGTTWTDDVIEGSKTSDDDLTQFSSLSDLSGTDLDKTVVGRISTDLNLGMSVIAKLKKEELVIGYITLSFQKDLEPRNLDLLRLYMYQLGLFIEKNRLGTALQASQKMFFRLAEFAPIGFVSCDTNGTIDYANRKLLELMDSPGFAATKRINLFELPSLQDSGFSEKLRECLLADKLITYEMRYTSIWGKSTWLRVHFSPNKENGAVVGAYIVTDDITDSKHQESELMERVQSDPLTQAFNRNILETILLDRLTESETKGLVDCFAILDVDDFKYINDRYGHKAGDSILRYLANRIKKELREHDLLIRTGGDEFLIYLHNIRNKENALSTIDRLFKKASGKYQLQDVLNNETICLAVSCSIGISMLPEDGKAVDILMVKADQAQYMVKNEGKSGYRFFS